MSEETCFVCREGIVGPHIATTRDKYHNDCFRCHQCLRPFPNNVFFETDQGFYCEEDYNILCLARCANCTEVITGKYINALDAKWHLEHFTCENCGRSLVGGSFVRKDDKPYCKMCPTDKVKVKKQDESINCELCKQPIEKNGLHFKGQLFHGHHFQCSLCHKQLDETSREFDGELYCFADYEKINSKICAECRKPIFGTSVSALGKIFHPEHFVCFKCENPFSGSKFYQLGGKAYCELHYKQATGSICQYCRKAVQGNAVSALNGKWCSNHFQCMGCFTSFTDIEKSKFMNFDGRPFCRKCFDRLPGDVRRAMTKYAEKEAKYV